MEIRKKFESLKENSEKALVAYFMVGYPDVYTSLKVLEGIGEGGADIIEIGMPFSDPVADGPTIQIAHEVALERGVRFKDVLYVSEKIKGRFPHIPLIIMTYYNPIFRIGLGDFCRKSKDAGISGLIVPDLPPEEADELKEATSSEGLSLIMLASPTSHHERLRKICDKTDDMTYLVSVTGTTGARDELPLERIRRKVEEYRTICTKPIVVGFGISNRTHVRQICEFADGVVVGSLLIKLADKGEDAVRNMVRDLKEGTRS